MFTLMFIGVVLFFCCLAYHIKVYEPAAQGVGFVLLGLCCILAIVSGGKAEKIPSDYVQIESYSYVTESGSIETLAGPYYTKDGAYYQKDMSRANWIPFALCNLVEVNLPKSETNNDPINYHQCPDCGYECATPYCGQCGTKVNQE